MHFLVIGVVLVAAIFFAKWASARHEAVMAKGARVNAPTAHTGAEVALVFLKYEGVDDVEVVEHNAIVSDYFDPTRRRLFLRRDVARGTTLAAWATALHEAAHALQIGDALGEFKWRQSCIRMNRYLPVLIVVAVTALALFRIMVPRIAMFAAAGLFLVLLLLNVGSLPIEFNANKRLRRFLDEHLRNHGQAHGRLDELLFGMAVREAGDFLRSPRYFFLSALPGTGGSRPAPSAPAPDKES